MFDIGFWEMLVLCVLGLLVLGPNKLPEVAIKIGTISVGPDQWSIPFQDRCGKKIELAPLRPDVPQEQDKDQEKNE